ncbi:hypothetical protein ACREYP_10220 [Enterobacter sp. TMH.L2]
MKRFSKVGMSWFFFLVAYCAVLITAVLFICQLTLSMISYINNGVFIFSWKESLYIALRKGSVAGATLGAGLWLKDKLYNLRKRT